MSNSSIVPSFEFLSNTIRTDGLVNITALSTAYRLKTGRRKDPAKFLLTSEAKESIGSG